MPFIGKPACWSTIHEQADARHLLSLGNQSGYMPVCKELMDPNITTFIRTDLVRALILQFSPVQQCTLKSMMRGKQVGGSHLRQIWALAFLIINGAHRALYCTPTDSNMSGREMFFFIPIIFWLTLRQFSPLCQSNNLQSSNHAIQTNIYLDEEVAKQTQTCKGENVLLFSVPFLTSDDLFFPVIFLVGVRHFSPLHYSNPL